MAGSGRRPSFGTSRDPEVLASRSAPPRSGRPRPELDRRTPPASGPRSPPRSEPPPARPRSTRPRSFRSRPPPNGGRPRPSSERRLRCSSTVCLLLWGRYQAKPCTCEHKESERKKRPARRTERASLESMSGCVLLSHTVTSAVPSALKGLASGFGMEPGVSPSL